MTHPKILSRREALKLSAVGLAAALKPAAAAPLKGRLKQSAARWCYNNIPLDELCKAGAAIGLRGIDLVNDPKDWAIVKKYGLTPSMVPGAGSIPDGFIRKENHDRLVDQARENIARAAEAGLPNVITFSGNRRGMPDGEGLENCVTGLLRVKPIAEQYRITVCLELLNSKVNHKDYMFDHMPWGVEVVKRVSSPYVKILYDIYHAQIMDGDIIRTIRDTIQWIGHFHTGGVPGRNELDDTQELNWRTVATAIADLGFQGFVAHEFVPKRDPLKSLKDAVELCDV